MKVHKYLSRFDSRAPMIDNRFKANLQKNFTHSALTGGQLKTRYIRKIKRSISSNWSTVLIVIVSACILILAVVALHKFTQSNKRGNTETKTPAPRSIKQSKPRLRVSRGGTDKPKDTGNTQSKATSTTDVTQPSISKINPPIQSFEVPAPTTQTPPPATSPPVQTPVPPVSESSGESENPDDPPHNCGGNTHGQHQSHPHTNGHGHHENRGRRTRTRPHW